MINKKRDIQSCKYYVQYHKTLNTHAGYVHFDDRKSL